MLSNILCNATGKTVKINWDKGVNIIIGADNRAELTSEQMNDFRPGQPGSEEVAALLAYNGVFLLDGDKSYEEQALTALRGCYRAKKAQYDAAVQKMRDNRLGAGLTVTDEVMEEAKRMTGYVTFEADVKSIKRRVDTLSKIVEAEGVEGKVKGMLDPRKTCFVTQPPREFPSEVALELFLLDQPADFVSQHKEMQSQMLGEE